MKVAEETMTVAETMKVAKTMKVAEEALTVAENTVKVNNSIDKPRKWFRKSIKVLGIVSITVVFLYSSRG